MDCKNESKCPFYEKAETEVSGEDKLCKEIDKWNDACRRNRAYGDPKGTEYYKLQINIGAAGAGTVFYYDPDDSVRGSIAEGCLKLAWSADGDCQCEPMLAGEAIVFPASFRKDKRVFERVYPIKNKDDVLLCLKRDDYFEVVG